MTDADLTRLLNRNRTGLPKMLVVVEQLDELFGYMSGRTTINKDLIQGLLTEYDLLVEERSAADASWEERPTQTDSVLFSGSASMQKKNNAA